MDRSMDREIEHARAREDGEVPGVLLEGGGHDLKGGDVADKAGEQGGEEWNMGMRRDMRGAHRRKRNI